MKILLVLVLVFISTQAVSYFDLVQEQWREYKLQYKKAYASPTEEKYRMKIFMENYHTISKSNQLYEQGLISYRMRINKYADMLPYEFVQTMNGFNRSTNSRSAEGLYDENRVTYIPAANTDLPDQKDWRDDGAVTPVKNQGECGSCWAFSAIGSLEGQLFLRNKVLVSLSEQNIVDCSVDYPDSGCSGGLMDSAFKYVIDNQGVDTEACYPYLGYDSDCNYNPSCSGGTATGFVDIIPHGDENQLKSAVATVGPVAVAIDASLDSFQFYSSGIYYEPLCSSSSLDHGVLVVGYGTDNGQDYWIVKNSWGDTWGDRGYIRMARNRNNNCGIATVASYPLV